MDDTNGMEPIPSPVKLTYEDYVLFPNDGKRHEVIDGEHYVTAAPITKHQRVSMRLSAILSTYLDEHPGGELFAAPFDVVLSQIDIVQPDLVYISAERSHLLTDQHVRGAPDLIIEILSESSRRVDEIIKRKLYERFGTHEYWVVDPELEASKVYRHAGGRFQREAELSLENDDALSTALFPGLSVPLKKIFW